MKMPILQVNKSKKNLNHHLQSHNLMMKMKIEVTGDQKIS